MRESKIEKYLVQKVVEAGGLVRKLKWIGKLGAPDRFIVLNGRVVLVECKALGELPRASQAAEIKKLTKHGVRVVVVDSYKAVDALVDGLGV